MEKVLKFICCNKYDFTNQETGERVQGISCSCFDPDENAIVKVKTDKMLDYSFGDDVEVKISIRGKYAHYVVA